MALIGNHHRSSSRTLGRVDVRGEFVSRQKSSQLADPIRHWFIAHPDEIASENYFSAIFEKSSDGEVLCFLELVGQHHWKAKESAGTMPQALKKALESALPSVALSDWENQDP